MILTPRTTIVVDNLVKQLMDESDYEKKKLMVTKVGKSCKLHMSDSVLQNSANTKLLNQLARKDGKKTRRKGTCTARVMNQEVLDDRREVYDWDTESGAGFNISVKKSLAANNNRRRRRRDVPTQAYV